MLNYNYYSIFYYIQKFQSLKTVKIYNLHFFNINTLTHQSIFLKENYFKHCLYKIHTYNTL